MIHQPSRNKANCCASTIVFIFYICASIFVLSGWIELSKSNNLIKRECYVKSVTLKEHGRYFYFYTNITVVNDGGQNIDDVLVGYTGTKNVKQARIKVRKYQINQTYPCYGPQNKTSVIVHWGYQWSKPSKWKASGLIFAGISLFGVVTLFRILKRCCLGCPIAQANTHQHQERPQLETLLSRGNQPQVSIHSSPPPEYSPPLSPLPPENPPPKYDEAVRELAEKQTTP